MKKTLEDELMSLAHKILRLRGKEDLEQMKVLTGELYEKLSVLSFAEKHFSKPQPSFNFTDVEDTLAQISKKESPEIKEEKTEKSAIDEADKKEDIVENITTKEKETISEKEKIEEENQEKTENPIKKIDDFSEIDLREISVHYDDLPQFEPVNFEEEKPLSKQEEVIKEEKEVLPKEISTPLTEEKPTEIEEENKAVEEKTEKPIDLGGLFSPPPTTKRKNNQVLQKRSLNQSLQVGLSFGLNDRLAFINNLFDGKAEDFNRVISQLNSFESSSEAIDFIQDQVKPDYSWEDKENYEERFLQAIEQKLDH